MSLADRANLQMVDRLIVQGALWSPELIAAFRSTPRHGFLRRVHVRTDHGWRARDLRSLGPSELSLAYSDRALTTRLSEGEPALAISSSSQPSLMAQMLEDLRPAGGQRVLEVGAGTGYNAALLAHVAGPGCVTSVDVDRVVLAEAAEHLRAFADRGLRLVHGDGREGCAGAAPFDRIMVTAATLDVEPAWLAQLTPGGVLLAPLALAPGLAFVLLGSVTEGIFHGRLTRPAFFMPLRAEAEAGGGPAGEAGPGGMDVIPAPWADWLGSRRLRPNVRGFLQSFAFHAWLRGLSVSYVTYGETPMFGLADRVEGCACWVEPLRWYVSGTAGRALGETLLREFIEAGTPWPSEYDLFASPAGVPTAGGPGVYVHQGTRCRQVWRLRRPRERPAAF